MAAQDLSTFNGLFKDQFHSDLEDLRPQLAILQDLVSWVPSDKMNGELYSIPTVLRSNQGVSYLGESGALATLSSARPGQMKEAQVKGSEMVVRGQITYKSLSQAATAGARAFKKSSAWLVEDLSQVAYTRLEIASLYGQNGIAVVETVGTAVGQTVDLTITAGSFAPGIWATLEGAPLDSITGHTPSAGTKNNSSGAIVVNSVNTSTRVINVTFVGTLASEITAGDTLFPEGAWVSAGVYNEMAGLSRQLSAVSGTLFAIDRGAYTLMQGNVVSASTDFTVANLLKHAMKAVDKGCMEDLVVLTGTAQFAKISAELAALRRFDSSYSETAKIGSKAIELTSVNGQLKIVCHPMVMPAHAFIFNPDDVLYVGSTKPTFEIPGMSEKFFRLVDGSNAVELQNYCDVAIYAIKPAQTVVLTNLTIPA